MGFFQNTVINKYRTTINSAVIETAFSRLQDYFHHPARQQNIRDAKEEQFQEGFLRELFVNVLGYTLNPDPGFNLTTEYRNVKDSRKADGAILFNDSVKAVIELKGTEVSDLARVENQAFSYKNNQTGCRYIITSNFEKIRFYIDNAIDHLEFNLFTLSRKEFALLWLCLSCNSLTADIPLKMKEESVSRENEITRFLYKDYSLFKRELHQNLVALNPQFDPLTLFKKSQKLLSRLLFLFFAEDRMLLPPNSVRLVLTDWRELREREVEIPLYDRFKKYFGYLNTGFKGKRYDVFAYNGGLFKPDEVLDTVQIGDELLFSHAMKLSEYDFASEVDVNILGHIFENSLNELEEIKAQLEGVAIDKSKTKRKKEGVFYTPKYITKYIVENTVGRLCREKREAIGIIDEEYTNEIRRQAKTRQGLVDRLTGYRNWLLQLTICDPACGSGAFLNQALDFLIAEHRSVDELQARLFGDAMVLSDFDKSILENNLYGVDLNEESVEIARLSLWLRTAHPNRTLNDLSGNIKVGNSLIDDPAVAGDKAFDWHKEFPQVFAKGGFDVVIGNPPYVRQELMKEYSNYWQKNYKVHSGKSDLYTYFYEKGVNLLKRNGYLSFITSGKFTEAKYGLNLLRFLTSSTQIVGIINFKDLSVFEGITAYAFIYTGNKKDYSDHVYEFSYFEPSGLNDIEYLNSPIPCSKSIMISIADFIQNGYKFHTKQTARIIAKIKLNSVYLSHFLLHPLVGVKTGYNEGYLDNTEDLTFSFPYIFGKNVKRYCTPAPEERIIFPYSFSHDGYKLVSEQELGLKTTFLEKHRQKLSSRAIIKEGIENGNKVWYEFQQINKILDFNNQYIVYPNVSFGNNFTLSQGSVVDMTCFIIPTNDKYILAILNSKLVAFIMREHAISRRGGYLEYKTQYLEQLPFKELDLKNKEEFVRQADQMLSLNTELHTLTSAFHRTLQRHFGLEEISTKLQNWYQLSYGEFVKELQKKKVKLTLAQEAEWEPYFLAEVAKAQELKRTIDVTDREIDRMVYELYGLTEEEIAIVEGRSSYKQVLGSL